MKAIGEIMMIMSPLAALAVGIYFLGHVLHYLMWKNKPFTYGNCTGGITETTTTTTTWSDGWTDVSKSSITYYYYNYVVNGMSYNTGKVYSTGESRVRIYYDPKDPNAYYAHVPGEEKLLLEIVLTCLACCIIGTVMSGETILYAIKNSTLECFVLYIPTILALMLYLPYKVPAETPEEQKKRIARAAGWEDSIVTRHKFSDPEEYEAYFRKEARENDTAGTIHWLRSNGFAILHDYNENLNCLAQFDSIKPKKTISEAKKDILKRFPYIAMGLILASLIIASTFFRHVSDTTGLMAYLTGNVSQSQIIPFWCIVALVIDLIISLPLIPKTQNAWNTYETKTRPIVEQGKYIAPYYEQLCRIIPERYRTEQEIRYLIQLCEQKAARSMEEAIYIRDREEVRPA